MWLIWAVSALSVVTAQIPPSPPPGSFPVGGAPPPPPPEIPPGPGPPVPPLGPVGPPPIGRPIVPGGAFGPEDLGWRCPEHWVHFQGSCYRFIKSPIRPREEAKRNCQVSSFKFFPFRYDFVYNSVPYFFLHYM